MDLVLLTDYRGALRQKQQVFQSLDVAKVRRYLQDDGISTSCHSFEEVANGQVEFEGRWIHYTSTQDPGYRTLLDDVLHQLSGLNQLVPRYELFRSHENKGMQQLLRKRLGLDRPASWYFANEKGCLAHADSLTFPLVFKPIAGYQSRAVSLVHDRQELQRRIRHCNRPRRLWRYRLKEFLKRHLLTDRYFPEMYEDCVYSGGFVLQEFLPGASDDWKILVMADRLFALRRQVRPGDFRASGSGRFSFDIPPDVVLDFADEVRGKLVAPMLSLDIIVHGAECFLVEFQATHFGTLTLDCAPHHFERQDGQWRRVDTRSELEAEYARSLSRFLAEATGRATTPGA